MRKLKTDVMMSQRDELKQLEDRLTSATSHALAAYDRCPDSSIIHLQKSLQMTIARIQVTE